MAEFDALKAKYGQEFADLKAARFNEEKQVEMRDAFVPYWCRENDEGFIVCEKERPE